MSAPRGVEERIDWMLDHPPGQSGMCAREVWQAIGGDQNPPNPPAWGCPDANACYDKVIASGRYATSTPIPRGAAIYWKYSGNGHAALSYGDGKIVTTDPTGDPNGTGIEPLSYPEKWGATSAKRIWTDQYNGVRFDIDGVVSHGDVYLSKLRYGQMDSDSVRRLQAHLNDHPLLDGSTLPITGNLLEQTAHEIRLDREQHGFAENVGDEFVSEAQVRHLIPFGECGCELLVDTIPEPPDPEPEPPDPVGVTNGFGLWSWYSGKPSSDFTLKPDGAWHKLGFVQPASGIDADSTEFHFLYLRVELPPGRSADRVLEAKFVRSDGDATAYYSETYGLTRDSMAFYDNHFESGSGLGGEWWVKVSGGTDPIKLTTRYAKTAVHYQDTPVELDEAVMSRGLYGWPLAAVLLLLAVLGVAGVLV